MEDQKFEVENTSGKIIGYTFGQEGGGLVYDASGNIVGAMMTQDGYWYLSATANHHTGKAMNGDTVFKSNRPLISQRASNPVKPQKGLCWCKAGGG